MKEECYEKECKFYTQIYEKQNDIWEHYAFCINHKKFILEEELCENYIKAEKCFNCKHRIEKVYETGTIDCVDYHCKLQNDKMIYSDIDWAISHYADFPDCNICKWESE